MVAAAIRTILTQPTEPLVHEQVEVVAAMLEPQLPQEATMLRGAMDEITAFAVFPRHTGARSGPPNPWSG